MRFPHFLNRVATILNKVSVITYKLKYRSHLLQYITTVYTADTIHNKDFFLICQ